MVACKTPNLEVAGSSPALGKTFVNAHYQQGAIVLLDNDSRHCV